MSDLNELVDDYLAIWNETDPAARRAKIDAVWTADCSYIDPMAEAHGRDQLDATIGAVQAQFPGFVFTLGEGVDIHHEQARFTWELGAEGAEAMVVGFDVAVFEDGRIRSVYGFLDEIRTP
ncbi:nuclear transport factor 2 family protein [Amycolatopsis regifaucium]|uniref:Polyketide cyclase n=1 Tax=Amycolatopsis regifaucium TaxID=546365 RepID=A0A154M3R2_9PSEU|nr:nuclear transport factor 2 family protein [Amycolatopsis regifaucium]KZB79228.1 polyketide cyclase [Amycolatopsis regifaucium]OKA07411.1 polyketide cyclase [Amycolatopsis regifaucium]SFH12065.1 SnoaL-like domain-containing protein [Amycolatopsis regifaucium]